jgi:excisionase family DNA binding protein
LTKAEKKFANDLIAKLRRMTSVLTPNETSRVLHKHVETIYRMIADRRLPAVLDGSRWKIDPSKLADWIEQRSTEFRPSTKPHGGAAANDSPAVEPDGDADGGLCR